MATTIEHIVSVVVGSVAAYLGHTSGDNEWCLAILWFYIGLISTEFILHLRGRKREGEDLVKQMGKHIDSRMKDIMRHACICEENNNFEKVLQSLHTTSDRKMWIVAKFISKKLNCDFASLEIEIDAKSYSDFVSNLYPECRDSIYLTCPFTPKEWFKQLYTSKEKRYNIEKIGVGDLPPHTRELLNSPVKNKKIHVILNPTDWEDMCKDENLPYLKKFLEVNKGLQLRFTLESELKEKLGIELRIKELDYMIFDEELMLIWEKPKKPNQPTTLGLHTDISPTHQILDIFDYDRYGFFGTEKDVCKEY